MIHIHDIEPTLRHITIDTADMHVLNTGDTDHSDDEQSDSTIDDIYYSDDDPILQDAWEEHWAYKQPRLNISNMLRHVPLSIAGQEQFGPTVAHMEARIAQDRAKVHSEIHEMRLAFYRATGKLLDKNGDIVDVGSSIHIVPDLKHITVPDTSKPIHEMKCKFGIKCAKHRFGRCNFTHPTAPPADRPAGFVEQGKMRRAMMRRRHR